MQGKSCRGLSPPSAATKTPSTPLYACILVFITKSLVHTTARLKESWSFIAGLLSCLLFHFVLLFLCLFLQSSYWLFHEYHDGLNKCHGIYESALGLQSCCRCDGTRLYRAHSNLRGPCWDTDTEHGTTPHSAT